MRFPWKGNQSVLQKMSNLISLCKECELMHDVVGSKSGKFKSRSYSILQQDNVIDILWLKHFPNFESK